MQATRRKPGLSGASIWHYSYTFVWYASQVALVDGLLFGMSLAFPVAFVVLCLATQNVILAFVAIITIGLIVASVLGTSFLMGWHLGIKESVAGVIVIGFSVDNWVVPKWGSRRRRGDDVDGSWAEAALPRYHFARTIDVVDAASMRLRPVPQPPDWYAIG